MTKEKAISRIQQALSVSNRLQGLVLIDEESANIAIEALQFAEHFDLLKEYQSLQEVVRCKDCIHQEHCHETVAHSKHHDGFIEHWSETIEWCSKGECKEE